jgi:hypothetical protein
MGQLSLSRKGENDHLGEVFFNDVLEVFVNVNLNSSVIPLRDDSVRFLLIYTSKW